MAELTNADLEALKNAYESAIARDPSKRLSYVEQAIAEGRVGQAKPGEAGSGRPSNYTLRPEYWDWRAKEPTQEEINAARGTERKPLNEWQETNPFYVNPKNYETFSDYASELLRTSPGNQASSADPVSYMSLIGGYYAGAHVPSRLYSEEELQAMPRELGTSFRRGMDFVRDYAGFEMSGIIPGNTYTKIAEDLGLIPRQEISASIPNYQNIINWKKTYDPNSLSGMSQVSPVTGGYTGTVPIKAAPINPLLLNPFGISPLKIEDIISAPIASSLAQPKLSQGAVPAMPPFSTVTDNSYGSNLFGPGTAQGSTPFVFGFGPPPGG